MMAEMRNKMLAAVLSCAATVAEKTDDEQLTARDFQRLLGLADIVCDVKDAEKAVREAYMASWLERVNAIQPYRWRIRPQGFAALARMGDGIARKISEIEKATDQVLERHAPVRPVAVAEAAAPLRPLTPGDDLIVIPLADPERLRRWASEHTILIRQLVLACSDNVREQLADAFAANRDRDEQRASVTPDEEWDDEVATVCLSEPALDGWWTALTPQKKAEVMADHLEASSLGGEVAPELTEVGRPAVAGEEVAR